MELKKAESRTRTIYPFPDEHPEFSLELRQVPATEGNRIRDRHGFNSRGGQTAAKEEKVIRAIAFASIIRVNGATHEGGQPLDPESDEARELVYGMTVEVEGQIRNLWVYAMELYAEEEAEDLKNSQRSSPTSTARA